MPDPPPAGPGRRGRLGAGVRLALTTFTVLPIRGGVVDRGAGAVAMALAPAVGALLGAALGLLALALREVGAPALVAGAVVVAAGALGTRGLHLDGLADTIDALGSHRDRERALEIMRSPEIGPFGAAAIVLVLLVQTASIGALGTRPGWWLACALGSALAAGRLAVSWACRRGVPAARPGGLGAMVAGTVAAPVAALATLAVLALSLGAVPGRPWQGPVAVLAALGVAAVIERHAVRRLGGVTGDVLGALAETGTTVALVVLTLSLAGR